MCYKTFYYFKWPFVMQQPSVLIIDDSEIERYMLSHQLKKIGVSEIVQKNDGTSGLEFLSNYTQNQQQYGANFPPAIIILDVNMQIMGGLIPAILSVLQIITIQKECILEFCVC